MKYKVKIYSLILLFSLLTFSPTLKRNVSRVKHCEENKHGVVSYFSSEKLERWSNKSMPTNSVRLVASRWEKTGYHNSRGGDIYLASMNKILFVGSDEDGIYRSTDNGHDFVQLISGFPTNDGSVDMFIQFLCVNGKILYAGTVSGGMYISTDTGSEWHSVNTNVQNVGCMERNCIFSVRVIGNQIFVLHRSSKDKILISINNGKSWYSKKNEFLPNCYIYWLTTVGSKLFVATSQGIFRSNDFTKSWVQVKTGFGDSLYSSNNRNYKSQKEYNENVYSIVGRDSILCARLQSRIVFSSNSGKDWKSIYPDKKSENNSGYYLTEGAFAESISINDSKLFAVFTNFKTKEDEIWSISVSGILSDIAKSSK